MRFYLPPWEPSHERAFIRDYEMTIDKAIERLTRWANSQTLVGEYAAYHRQADIRALLAELERLRKPVEDAEVADIVGRLQGVTLFQSYDYNLALNNEAADLISRLARERDEARKTLDTCADAFCDAAQLIDGHKGDDWSNWDEQARSKITNCLSSIRALKDKANG